MGSIPVAVLSPVRNYTPAAEPELGLLNPNWIGLIPSGGTIYFVDKFQQIYYLKLKGKSMSYEKYETYNHLQEPVKSFEDLRGRILSRVEQIGNDELRFYLTNDHYVRMYHQQDCCEYVSIEDIVGDLDDLVGTPLLVVEERVSRNEDGTEEQYCDSYTWTYYSFRTIKGSVDIRWYGSSNGYYSESVDIDVITGDDE
jgi:hypothetical protein